MFLFYYLLGAEEGGDGGYGKGFLEGIDSNVSEVGGAPGNWLIRIVHKYFYKSQGENSLECLPHASRVRAIYSDGEHLRLLLPRYFVCKSRQSPCNSFKTLILY